MVSANSLIKASRAFENDIFEFYSENDLLFNGIKREEKNRYTQTVADPAVGDPATATPRKFFFRFFLGRKEKRGVLAPRIRFENRFLVVIAAPSTNRYPLTNFMDPPLHTEAHI